jgi:hypothetical protein
VVVGHQRGERLEVATLTASLKAITTRRVQSSALVMAGRIVPELRLRRVSGGGRTSARRRRAPCRSAGLDEERVYVIPQADSVI